ncbi:MAG: hypothetical protein JWL57_3636 [Actinobacteria bacterium]|nr:hypothetical protein [Actinomycetota bacterium]
MLAFGAALSLLAGSCSHPSSSASHIADPPASVPAKPDYTQSCSPSGADASVECAQVVLQSIDNARAKEHVGPMVLPSNFGKLSVPQQLFVALNRERVDRRLPPITGLSDGLSALAERGASTGRLPADPGSGYSNADTEWIGAVANALDAVYQWMYEKGSAWADRHAVLDDFGSAGTVVMGASFSPTGDTDPTDGGTSLAAVVAVAATPGPLAYAWTQAQADLAAGTLRPRGALPTNASATHIADPPQTVPANPDFTEACAPSGLDSSAACIQSALEAVDNARAAEGVKAMVLPTGFASLTVPKQLFVAVNLERVDRGLPPFAGLTAALNANAQRGADIANDPPDPGKDYDVVDTEWAGGSSNGLDAVYGWMYDDGVGSGNLDCPKGGGPGCWGHRHGILDDFGTVGTLVMGAALNPTSDTGDDKGGPSMAASLAITSKPVPGYTYTWAQATGSPAP